MQPNRFGRVRVVSARPGIHAAIRTAEKQVLWRWVLALFVLQLGSKLSSADDLSAVRARALAVLKVHCVRCHGPLKQEGALNLAAPVSIARGGESGPSLLPGRPDQSRIWQRMAAGEMPPGEAIPAADQETIRHWIELGAPGLPPQLSPPADGEEHWAFQPLRPVILPPLSSADEPRTPIDRLVQIGLAARGLALQPRADRETLIRRVCFDLTGLPPSPGEVAAFLLDDSLDAYERMVDRYLHRPSYGERWGKLWLDAAGYADSNGYFNADTDRPFAFRYRDYVVRAVNADKPWDLFVREQLAGDEIVDYHDGIDFTADVVSALEAVHFLRNSQDGTDSSDGNDDELRVDRYTVLEGMLQIIGSSLLGMTSQCAKCHDHKFEPFTQRDYYQLQAIFFPAFNVDAWVKPNQREICTATPDELAQWRKQVEHVEQQVVREQAEFLRWVQTHRESALPTDANTHTLSDRWQVTFVIDPQRGDFSSRRTCQFRHAGKPVCQISGDANGPTKCTVVSDDGSNSAEHVLGTSPWQPGHEYALRFTKSGDQWQVWQLVDGRVEEPAVVVSAPISAPIDASIGAMDCAWQEPAPSVALLREPLAVPGWSADQQQDYHQRLTHRRELLDRKVEQLNANKPDKPGRLAFVSDLSASPPVVPLLVRGNPKQPGEPVTAAPPTFLGDSRNRAELQVVARSQTTGRRLAFANWLTRDNARAKSLMARVTVNRWWSHHFGVGLVPTTDNLGYSAELPTQADLLEYLAYRLMESGWSAKAVHYEILCSETYKQSSAASKEVRLRDPDNRWLSRFPLRRLDAESIRDAMLSISGTLDDRMYGPYIPTRRNDQGEVVVAVDHKSQRRSLYLQQRRTQVLGSLEVFDAPSLVVNCTNRTSTTVPLQSLQMLNDLQVRDQASQLSRRLRREVGDDVANRIRHAYQICLGRPPRPTEESLAHEFVSRQQLLYEDSDQMHEATWIDFCQMLMASNPFLYLH